MIEAFSEAHLKVFRLPLGRWPSMYFRSREGDTDGILNRLPRRVRVSLVIVAAAILLPVGVLMLVLPGPGLLLIGAGLALLAGEFPLVRAQLQRAGTIVAALRTHLTG
jgi:hypothetical protein